MLCEYRDFFGKPREGAHAWRFMDFAMVDFIGTAVIAFFVSRYYRCSFVVLFLALLGLGVVFHRLFCVNTKLNTMLFGEV